MTEEYLKTKTNYKLFDVIKNTAEAAKALERDETDRTKENLDAAKSMIEEIQRDLGLF